MTVIDCGVDVLWKPKNRPIVYSKFEKLAEHLADNTDASQPNM